MYPSTRFRCKHAVQSKQQPFYKLTSQPITLSMQHCIQAEALLVDNICIQTGRLQQITSLVSPILLKVGDILLLLSKLVIKGLQSAIDLHDKVFSALACLAHHEHDLLQAVEHQRPDMPRALSDEVLQPRPLDMPETQEDRTGQTPPCITLQVQFKGIYGRKHITTSSTIGST